MNTKHRFRKNSTGISLLYDTLFFLVLLSVSSAILAPSLYSVNIKQTTFAVNHQQTATDSLQTLLYTREDFWSYRIGGNYFDYLASILGVNVTNNTVYAITTDWMFAREQQHKNIAELLSENLLSQCLIRISKNQSYQINCFTQEYTQRLHERINQRLETILGKGYAFNFTAIWQPLKGIPFGGTLSTGEPIPNTDTYAAQRILTISYLPTITWGNQSYTLSKTTGKQLSDQIQFQNNRYLYNIDELLQSYYANGSNNQTDLLKKKIQENITGFLDEFFFTDVTTINGTILFPGLFNDIVDRLFLQLLNLAQVSLTAQIEETIGYDVILNNDLLQMASSDTIYSYLIQELINQMTSFISLIQNSSISMDNEPYIAIKNMILTFISSQTRPMFQELGNSITEYVLSLPSLVSFVDVLFQHIIDLFQFSTAYVYLTIWRTT